jgi:chromosome segregation ATPase
MVECSIGEWVLQSDYARLKAEGERYRLASLRVDVGELHAQFNRALFDETVAENARLKAEVERLKKPTSLSESPTWNAIGAYAEAKEEVKQLKAQVKKLTEAGNAMDNAISEIDPQRAERHRFMRMTDAEYLAVMKWRVTKDPNYNRA